MKFINGAYARSNLLRCVIELHVASNDGFYFLNIDDMFIWRNRCDVIPRGLAVLVDVLLGNWFLMTKFIGHEIADIVCDR